MGVVCELARVKDETIDRFINSGELVDNFIDSEFHLIDATYFESPCHRFYLDKAWNNIQFGIYPNHNIDTSHILSTAIVHAHKFKNTEDRKATYLHSNEVKGLWQVLRELNTEQFLSNLNLVINNFDFISEWDYMLTAKTEQEKEIILDYTMMHFTRFVSAYHSAWIYKDGLLIYYS